MLSIALRQAGHTRKYRLSPSDVSGWDFTMHEDLRPIRHVHYDDWHRVERVIATVELEVRELTAKGWSIESLPLAST